MVSIHAKERVASRPARPRERSAKSGSSEPAPGHLGRVFSLLNALRFIMERRGGGGE